jgi:hypothetical protein
MNQQIMRDFAIIFVVSLLLIEIALRMQQYFGPIYDLQFDDVTLDGLSDVVNHKPLRKNTRKLSGSSIYGEFDGYEYNFYYDAIGIRQNTLRSNNQQDNFRINILFLGDSFIQGYDDKNTVPQHVWAYLTKTGLKTNIYNAAFYSYSPAIFIPQSKQIVPRLNPDFILVDIDETDLGDDFIKYRHLIVRDHNGKNIAVKPSPLHYEHQYGFLSIKKNPIFIVRLLKSLYHTKIHMPAFSQRFKTDNRSVLEFSRNKIENAKEIYQTEINFFRDNVIELADTLIQLVDDRRKILFLYHPHLQHLKVDSNGQYWNRFVSTTVKEVADYFHIAFYDASDELTTLFNGKPQEYYWDKNIHFNFKGLNIYGELVAKRLLKLINNTGKTQLFSDRINKTKFDCSKTKHLCDSSYPYFLPLC